MFSGIDFRFLEDILLFGCSNDYITMLLRLFALLFAFICPLGLCHLPEQSNDAAPGLRDPLGTTPGNSYKPAARSQHMLSRRPYLARDNAARNRRLAAAQTDAGTRAHYEANAWYWAAAAVNPACVPNAWRLEWRKRTDNLVKQVAYHRARAAAPGVRPGFRKASRARLAQAQAELAQTRREREEQARLDVPKGAARLPEDLTAVPEFAQHLRLPGEGTSSPPLSPHIAGI